ncbi:hypothetical protein EVAR_2525_1 [Eumeta japonica]|uniref:Uncharacterized protein n=1 Tax=Eumeta variegata TaxID=151549 RepID=A0A4C1SRH4_EUMVA|nr:hypothetical protein EVAR_2525_1 [Eumeta japonica]
MIGYDSMMIDDKELRRIGACLMQDRNFNPRNVKVTSIVTDRQTSSEKQGRFATRRIAELFQLDDTSRRRRRSFAPNEIYDTAISDTARH